MAVDADPSSPNSVETSITINGTGKFSIGINVTQANTAYNGYQVEIQFPNAGLDFAGTTTPNGSSPFQLCQAPNHVFSSGNTIEFVQDACAKSTPGSVAYIGQVETIDLKCASGGTFPIHMTTLVEDPVFGTTTLDQSSSPILTARADATVTCIPLTDTDGDGCPDVRELGSDWHTGGQRDPLNPWDFVDMPVPVNADPSPSGPRSGAVTISDVLSTLFYVGTYAGDVGKPNANGVTYDSTKDGDWFNATTGTMGQDGVVGPDDAVGRRFDRTAGANPWQAGPPNGAVTIADVMVVLNSIGTRCN